MFANFFLKYTNVTPTTALCFVGCVFCLTIVFAQEVPGDTSVAAGGKDDLSAQNRASVYKAVKDQDNGKKQKADSLFLPAPTRVTKPTRAGAEKRVDNWVDAWLTAQTGPAGQAIQGRYKPDHDLLDTTDAKAGYFAVRYTVKNPQSQRAFGFQAGPYLAGWELGRDFSVKFWIKAESKTVATNWIVALFDKVGKRAHGVLEGMATDGKWHQFSIPFDSLSVDEGFDFKKVISFQVETELPKNARIWLDDVVFKNGPETLGVSDKTVTQYMAEAEASRPQRVHEFLATPNNSPAFQFIADLYTSANLEKVNQEIIAWVRKFHSENGEDGENSTTDNASWGLWTNSALHWLLFGFSSKGKIAPGRLTPECEKELLSYYWKHLNLKNDIATARQSSWWVTGSENHDINFKSANLLSSQLFKNNPDYAKKIYPDLGRMQGYGYGSGGTFRAGQGSPVIKMGSGRYKDGNDYNASDHYEAWVAFWKDFLAERARHGFFIEHNAPGYMSHTQRFLHDIYAWSEDKKVREQARMFIDLVWAQWAQDQILSINTGVAVRGGPGWTRMGRMSEFLLGGAPGLGGFYGFSDYQLPRQVWEMLLDRPGMGEYAFSSRKPNEAQDVWPQPTGTEYTILARPDSRLVRYTWVTPDYSMGTRMDHPDALYSHLSTARGGVNFPTNPNAMIQWGGNLLAVQDKGAALMQQKKTVRYQHPLWFPAYSPQHEPLQVILGSGLDRIEEKDGWVFVQAGNAYTALRIVTPAAENQEVNALGRPLPTPVDFDKEGFGLFALEPKAYILEEGVPKFKGATLNAGKTMTATNLNSGLVVESSRKEQHATFEDFQKDVLDNPIHLKQVIADGFLLTYRACGKDSKELELNCSSNQIPRVGGEFVRYDSPTFDSPFLRGEAGGGVVTLAGPISGKKAVLNFNKIERNEE
jgi:hypothetical protein